jgi:hypothetical protein
LHLGGALYTSLRKCSKKVSEVIDSKENFPSEVVRNLLQIGNELDSFANTIFNFCLFQDVPNNLAMLERLGHAILYLT